MVDPIDGTVNFAYGIPHAAVCISLEQRRDDATFYDGCKPVVAVIFDPFAKELWTAILGGPARLNGRIIQASQRTSLREAIITMGFAKSLATMNQMLPAFNRLVPRVRKIRMMGSAALALAYVASGRFDGYLEYGLRRWDISAGALLVECAGGSIWQKPLKQAQAFEIIASSRALQKPLSRLR